MVRDYFTTAGGRLPIAFSSEMLVGYLLTQSNVEYAVHQGARLDDLRRRLLDEVSGLDLTESFTYAFSYEIYEYGDDRKGGRPGEAEIRCLNRPP